MCFVFQTDTKMAAGLGILKPYGVRSKLDMLEPLMTKQGQSMKVMRSNLIGVAA